jgi:hypothetical protein
MDVQRINPGCSRPARTASPAATPPAGLKIHAALKIHAGLKNQAALKIHAGLKLQAGLKIHAAVTINLSESGDYKHGPCLP